MTNRFFHFALLCLLCLTAGCSMDFDYTGQSFAPRPESAPVTFFTGRQEIPEEEFRIIGRGILTVTPKTGDYDRMGELREQARKHGADGVCLLDTTEVISGVFPDIRDEYIPPHPPRAKAVGVSVKDSPWDEESIKPRDIVSGTKKHSVLKIRFLFLKKAEEIEKELSVKNPLL